MTGSAVNARAVMRWLMAAFYIIAGIGHLAAPDAFLPIVPDWVPMPRGVISPACANSREPPRS